jgi:hypothetical protein
MEHNPSWEANSHLIKKFPEGSLPCSQWPANSEALYNTWLKVVYLWWRIVSPSPNLQAQGPPLVRKCLFNLFAATPTHLEALHLHPQHEDEPSRGDRDPHNMDEGSVITYDVSDSYQYIYVIAHIICSHSVCKLSNITRFKNKCKLTPHYRTTFNSLFVCLFVCLFAM